MKIRISFAFLGFAFVLFACPAVSLANKSSVKIEAPASADKDSEIVIRIHVTHKGNNFIHYTNWVEVKINDKPVQRWEFKAFNRPEEETFTKELKYKVTEQITITAEANCNLHGSEGPATERVLLVPDENGETSLNGHSIIAAKVDNKS